MNAPTPINGIGIAEPQLSPDVQAALDDIAQGIYACVRRKREKRAEAAAAALHLSSGDAQEGEKRHHAADAADNTKRAGAAPTKSTAPAPLAHTAEV